MRGSPPRVRGKPRSGVLAGRLQRITPARAGKTLFDPQADNIPEDHPRACGENTAFANWAKANGGSPPRVRGKLSSPSQAGLGPRITPARAGKTRTHFLPIIPPPDHPRACGENSPLAASRIARYGSPPRVRGKQLSQTRRKSKKRITPARAGKTPDIAGFKNTLWDHPRACGENVPALRVVQVADGSPPRVRGKPFRPPPAAPPRRITPARAGKTHTRYICDTALADHPRACGENLMYYCMECGAEGSPPRVRGKRQPLLSHVRGERITPARAGKTWITIAVERRREDHPRACGENFHAQRFVQRALGSPPRVRGKRYDSDPERCDHGITPARAGKT